MPARDVALAHHELRALGLMLILLATELADALIARMVSSKMAASGNKGDIRGCICGVSSFSTKSSSCRESRFGRDNAPPTPPGPTCQLTPPKCRFSFHSEGGGPMQCK